MATEEQRRPEVDAEQEAEGGLALRGRRPRQPDNGFPISTIPSNGRGSLSSEHEGGAKSLVEGDEFSWGSFELKNGGFDFSDPKTSPDHVILNLTTEKNSIRTDGEINMGNEDDIKIVSTFVVPSTSSPQEQIVNDTTIDIDIRETEHVRVDSDPTTEREQTKIDHLYLASVYSKPDACEFYCPNCKACIDKVLIRSREDEEVRCPSCFEFLKPIGDWFFNRRTPDTTRPVVTVRPPPPPTTSFKVPSSNSNGHAATDTSFPTMPPAVPAPDLTARASPDSPPTTLVPPTSSNKTPSTVPPEVAARESPPTTFLPLTSSNKMPSTVPPAPEVPVLPSPPATLVPPTLSKEPPDSAYKNGATDSSFTKMLPTVPGNQDAVSEKPEVTVGPAPPVVVTPVRPTNRGQSSPVMWEILKSVVYGGLTESITSLSIVTSAASAAASTADIVVLALANLIGGLFVIGHHLTELKNCPSQVISSETSEQLDRYEEVLGQKRNFILHATFAVLSFLVFGLVPPLVYGFSFYESDNRYLKLAVVAAASLISIIVLAIAKAYTQKPPYWYTYVTTVMYYAALGVGASGMSYLAGYLIGKLIDKLGWFESTAAITLSLPGMSSVKTSWESY